MSIPVFRKLWNATAFSSFGDWLGLLATTAIAQQLAFGTPTLIFGSTGQADMNYEENVLRSPLIYLPSNSLSIEWVTNAFDGILKVKTITGKI